MSHFFVHRPIVAIVIAILMVTIGVVSMLGLPTAQFPNIVPPEVLVTTSYVGADALTVEQSVATPIEQQMAGVDNMNYMYSVNANDGSMTLRVNFDVKTDPNTDQNLTQMRKSQAESQIPLDVRNNGINVQKSTASPLVMFALFSPDDSYDNVFLANYAHININDQMTRVAGIASVTVFGAGKYAMRIWVKPDQLAKLNITIPEIIEAVKGQNRVNPAGQIGSEPVPSGQEFTYTVRAQGRLETEEEFGDIVIRAKRDGSIVRVRDVGRVELGAQTYNMAGRLNGKPAALVALYQLPGSNALAAAEGAKRKMEELKKSFPPGLDYMIALDTTLAVSEGIDEIMQTLIEALVLVVLVVFIFLQGWRATLIPLLAVPVSLVSTFAFFPLLDFSINTLSLFGLVLAIGLVVDDPIVVVESVEHHIDQGLSPKDATLKTMKEVTGPVIATSLVLLAVFLPTVFIPGITGRLYQQFAVTVCISVLISTFNALTLSPALSALLLRKKSPFKGVLQSFFVRFNGYLEKATERYVGTCDWLIRKILISAVILGVIFTMAGISGKLLPGGFLPEEDQGYIFAGIQLPNAASLQRTDETARKVEEVLSRTPGIASYATVVGYSLLSQVSNTYSSLFFIALKPWSERGPNEKAGALITRLNRDLAGIPDAMAFAFAPPAIPGIGTSGGITMVLEDRAGRDLSYLSENVQKFLAAARKRPELGQVSTTFLPTVPQVYVDVERDKVLKQGIQLADVYTTLQSFMGSGFINYFNRFGRQWQIYVQAEGEYRRDAAQLGQFYVRNDENQMVPLDSLTKVSTTLGPEFTLRFNSFRSAQINASPAPGFSSAEGMTALEETFEATMPKEMGFDYLGMSYQEYLAQKGVSVVVIFAFALFCAFLILAAQYESWSLPFSVLLGTPIALLGAFVALLIGHYENNLYAQIGIVMLIGLAAKNAILIVEFAKIELEKGKSPLASALEAARLRLRPILMTAVSFILGCIPLATADGAGGLSRQVMGYTVIGGMVAATLIAIFLIPVLFFMVESLKSRFAVHEEP